jgi:Flp pilus assembly protein TadD
MGKLYVPSQARTSADGVRADLDRAETILCDLSDAGTDALALPRLFDRIERGLEALERLDVDVRVERTRFETMQRQLRRRRRAFLKQARRALDEARREVEPPRSHWWWYLDEEAARERRRTWLRRGVGATLIVVLLTGAWFAYQLLLAPPPEVGQAYRRIEAGISRVEDGDLQEALGDFSAATELTPNDPEPWLWKGALHDQLGEPVNAERAFAEAEPLFETSFGFFLNRGRIYLHSGSIEKARADIKEAMALKPTSGWPYYLRAGISVREGDYDAALADLERARELAGEDGDARLQNLAASQQARLMQIRAADMPE